MALDAALALVLAAVSFTYVAIGHRPGLAQLPLGPLLPYTLAALSTLPVALRRRYPLSVLGTVLVASVVFFALDGRTVTATGAVWVLYVVAVQTERRRAVAALIAVEAGVAITFALAPATPPSVGNSVLSGALSGLTQLTVWVIGDSVRRRRAYVADQAQQSDRRAVVEERLRIARELHDVVAHAMSVIAVQAGAGHHVTGAQPEEAGRALAAIETTTRGALVEMRRLLGVLRQDGQTSASLAPSPGLADLEALVTQVGKTGLPTRLRVDGDPRPLPAGVDLSAYRIIQEALTNVVNHADHPSLVTVAVRYEAAEVSVEVTDDGRGGSANAGSRGGGTGHGLVGMRERVGLFGGRLVTGPRVEGGFRVAAHLPLGRAVR